MIVSGVTQLVRAGNHNFGSAVRFRPLAPFFDRKLLVLVFEQTIEQAFLLFLRCYFRTQINDFDGFGIFRLLGLL